MPIQVYLDTSDYWKFASAARNGDTEALETLQSLVALRDQKKIEIRYSFVHVFELVNYAPQHRADALVRCRCLSELSQGKCLRYINDIVRQEVSAFLNGKSLKRKHTRAPLGMWADITEKPEHGSKHILLQEFRRFVAQRSTGLSRQRARAIERRLLPGGKLAPAVQENLRKQGGISGIQHSPETAKIVSFQFGAQIANLVDQFLTDKISERELQREMNRVFLDPIVLAGELRDAYPVFSDHAELIYKIGGQIRSYAMETKTQFEELISLIDAHIDEAPTLDVEKLAKLRSVDLLRKFMHGEVDELSTQALLRNGVPSGSVPSIEALAWVIAEYVGRLAQNLKFKPKGSDAGDIIHSMYLPYVDIFRCDKDTYNVINAVGDRFGTTVVKKLNGLVPAIENRIAHLN